MLSFVCKKKFHQTRQYSYFVHDRTNFKVKKCCLYIQGIYDGFSYIQCIAIELTYFCALSTPIFIFMKGPWLRQILFKFRPPHSASMWEMKLSYIPGLQLLNQKTHKMRSNNKILKGEIMNWVIGHYRSNILKLIGQ